MQNRTHQQSHRNSAPPTPHYSSVSTCSPFGSERALTRKMLTGKLCCIWRIRNTNNHYQPGVPGKEKMDIEFILKEKLPFVTLMSSESTFASIWDRIWYQLFMNVSHLDDQSLPLVLTVIKIHIMGWGNFHRITIYLFWLHINYLLVLLTYIPSGKKSYL